MAGISDDNPGGWQYGSHLVDGTAPLQELLAEPHAEPAASTS